VFLWKRALNCREGLDIWSDLTNCGGYTGNAYLLYEIGSQLSCSISMSHLKIPRAVYPLSRY
jgi:hypothetical protein